jgi:hypothetical protein
MDMTTADGFDLGASRVTDKGQNMARKQKDEQPAVEADEAALEQRRRDTEALMNSPEMQAEMDACRRAFEEEQRQKAVSDEQPDEDEDSELAAWAQKLVAERAPDRLEDTDGEEDDEELVVYGGHEAPAPSVVDVPVAPAPPEPVWIARGQRAYPPKSDDDPFDLGRVADVEIRLWSDKAEYRLTIVEDGVEDRVWVGPERDGWGAALAMRRVKIDKEADYEPVNKLPRVHPGEVERRERAAKRFQEQMGNFGLGVGGRRREMYQDRDVTGQPAGTWSDGSSTWTM